MAPVRDVEFVAGFEGMRGCDGVAMRCEVHCASVVDVSGVMMRSISHPRARRGGSRQNWIRMENRLILEGEIYPRPSVWLK